MTEEKIAKLREMADRGTVHEKENAKRILSNLGIDWRKPKIPVVDKVKSVFGYNIKKKYSVSPNYASDLLLLGTLLSLFTIKREDYSLSIENGKIYFECTEDVAKDVMNAYTKMKASFSNEISRHAQSFISKILRR